MDCPEETTNIFGRLTFSWLTPLMKLGHKTPLVQDDLWNLPHGDEAEVISYKFQKNWQKELKKKK